jgi:hypothetical protein
MARRALRRVSSCVPGPPGEPSGDSIGVEQPSTGAIASSAKLRRSDRFHQSGILRRSSVVDQTASGRRPLDARARALAGWRPPTGQGDTRCVTANRPTAVQPGHRLRELSARLPGCPAACARIAVTVFKNWRRSPAKRRDDDAGDRGRRPAVRWRRIADPAVSQDCAMRPVWRSGDGAGLGICLVTAWWVPSMPQDGRR